MSSVKTTRYLVYGALAIGGFELMRRCFISGENDPVKLTDHGALLRRVGHLENERDGIKTRVDRLDGGSQTATHWIPWIKDKVTAFRKNANYFIPGWIASGVMTFFLVPAAFSYVKNKFPQIEDYISYIGNKIPQVDAYTGLNPTINWCMFTGTPFLESLGAFIGWYEGLELDKQFDAENPEAPLMNLNKKDYAGCCRSLVSAMEKVLGYMSYVTEQLKPTDKKYLILKASSEVSMDAITAEMKELVAMMNVFLTEEFIDAQMLDNMMTFWNLKMILILDSLEDFEHVTLAAGYTERDGKGRFNFIKKAIAPKLPRKPEAAPTTGPLEDVASEIFSQVAQTVF